MLINLSNALTGTFVFYDASGGEIGATEITLATSTSVEISDGFSIPSGTTWAILLD